MCHCLECEIVSSSFAICFCDPLNPHAKTLQWIEKRPLRCALLPTFFILINSHHDLIAFNILVLCDDFIEFFFYSFDLFLIFIVSVRDVSGSFKVVWAQNVNIFIKLKNLRSMTSVNSKDFHADKNRDRLHVECWVRKSRTRKFADVGVRGKQKKHQQPLSTHSIPLSYHVSNMLLFSSLLCGGKNWWKLVCPENSMNFRLFVQISINQLKTKLSNLTEEWKSIDTENSFVLFLNPENYFPTLNHKELFSVIFLFFCQTWRVKSELHWLWKLNSMRQKSTIERGGKNCLISHFPIALRFSFILMSKKNCKIGFDENSKLFL